MTRAILIASGPYVAFVVALTAVLGLGGCQTLTPQNVSTGCSLAKAGAAVGEDVAKGGAHDTATTVGKATDDACAGLTGR